MKLGVFGGSFDPPHIGHARVASNACDALELDLLLWIPAAVSPHKLDFAVSPSNHRRDMVQIMVRSDRRFQIDTREIKRAAPSFTVDTLGSIALDYPQASLYLIVGQDSLSSFDSWKQPDAIRDLAKIAVYTRGPTRKNPPTGCDIVIPGKAIDVSSSDIRTLVGSGKDFHDLVPPQVATYILANGLYLQR